MSLFNSEILNLVQKVDLDKVPKHVAIIMDGNGRWANERHFGRIRGHRAGVESIRKLVKIAKHVGVRFLTLYAFSSENWSRPKPEIQGLFKLLEEFVTKEILELKEQGVSLKTIGDISRLPETALNKLKEGIETTKSCKNLDLVLALNYGSQDEILKATQNIVSKRLSRNDDSPITKEEFVSNFYTASFPDPDLMIRTSGECRISNFLLWQLAYTELYFDNVLWPDYRESHFLEAILSFQKRDRRYGGV